MQSLVSPTTLSEAAHAVLCHGDAAGKAALSRASAAAWRVGTIATIGAAAPPDRPARPLRPALAAPRDMPRRRAAGSRRSRIALLHALAHIELNAIDLAWDIVARFRHESLPQTFYADWVAVADEEAKHFELLAGRLAALGAAYGDLPAHDGLWQAAEATADDLLARLAIVPLVLEARGLDVTPKMIARLEGLGDAESAGVLRVIYQDEIRHVAAGMRWFAWLAARRGAEPVAAWQELVSQRFRGRLKPPFNDAARRAAGLGSAFYGPIAG
jgi:uncharacterized ferritin-like protein (DUF455 family)